MPIRVFPAIENEFGVFSNMGVVKVAEWLGSAAKANAGIRYSPSSVVEI